MFFLGNERNNLGGLPTLSCAKDVLTNASYLIIKGPVTIPLNDMRIASPRPITALFDTWLTRARIRAPINEEPSNLVSREEEIICYVDGHLTASGFLLRGCSKVKY